MTASVTTIARRARLLPRGWRSGGVKVFVYVVCCVALLANAAAMAHGTAGAGEGSQMPDASSMSGMPLPVGDLAPGTVVVRVVRGSMSNPLSSQPVELHGGPAVVTQNTNDTGRAEFSGLTPGSEVRAVTVVDGQRLESQQFAVPASGGIRVMLVALDPEAAARAAEDRKLAESPAQPGTVVLGEQTRFVFELGEDGLSVFYILQVVNSERVPVEPPQPLVLDLPDRADHPSILQGSSPQGQLTGKRLTIAGPFAPGMTLVQLAYAVPYSGGTLALQQALPAPLTQFTVLAQKVGDLHLASPQMAQHRDMSADGQTYIVGHGPALAAGDVMSFEFTGLPHTPVWPKNLAVALALVILAAGAWGAVRTGRAAALEQSRRRKLEGRRDRLFSDLTALEEQHRAGRLEPHRYAARRRELVGALERLYAELDEEAAA